jgi:hypothetical protein
VPQDESLRAELEDLHLALLDFLVPNPAFRGLYDEQVVHGYIPERNIKTHALQHVKAETIVQMDVYSAFPRTNREKVLRGMEFLGAPPELTRRVLNRAFIADFLPLGFPTSPLLFTIAMLPLDLELWNFSKAGRLTYSRYTDDLAFSAERGIVGQGEIEAISGVAKKYGYDLHKIRVGHPRSKPVVLCGVSLFRERIYLSNRRRKEIRSRLQQILSSGEINDPLRARGLLEYVRFIYGEIPRSFLPYGGRVARLNARMGGAEWPV